MIVCEPQVSDSLKSSWNEKWEHFVPKIVEGIVESLTWNFVEW